MDDETAVFDGDGRFTGHARRECGGHQPSQDRAWCPDCTEWCYPDAERACRGCELPLLRAGLAELKGKAEQAQAEARRVKAAYSNLSRHVEQTLAAALGYPKYGETGPDSPGNPDDYVTGDHTAETLAGQAARELSALRPPADRRSRIPRSAYLRIGEPGKPLDSMTWPNPGDPGEVQWRLRYGSPDQADLLFAAAVMSAYAHLFDMPRRVRDLRFRQVKNARDAQDGTGFSAGDRVSAVLARSDQSCTGTFAVHDGVPVAGGCEIRPGSARPAPPGENDA